MTQMREDIILQLGREPLLAHRALFRHRHPEDTQSFHNQLIEDWHSPMPNVGSMVFRGGGKSTVAEEAIVVMACLRQFKNALVIGETETRAKERLAAIKNEFETNDKLLDLFGDLRGPKWQESYIELSNGSVIQAYGRGQSLRGVKHLHYRPDLALLDDLEDEESVRTPESRQKTLDWFTKTLMPALTPKARVRMAATPLHPEALALRLSRSPAWTWRKYPITYKDEDSQEQSTWSDRYPLEWIRSKRKDYEELGELRVWMQEYMCEAENAQDKTFSVEMFRSEALIRTWQPVYAVYDPARTVKATSASTGKVVGSWVNNRLVVWEASGHMWKPDEIIEDIFKVEERYNPVLIGVEEDGLHEFIMQPLRHAQITRGQPVPIKPLKAPKGKLDFIKGLQPFFKAGEVIFASESGDMEELKKQLLSFPTGRIDVPNALAYFLTLRPGIPIFDGFNANNIVEDIAVMRHRPIYLCCNATNATTTVLMVQVYDGVLNILADYVREGDPGAVLPDIIKEASLFARKSFTLTAPPQHFAAYAQTGLVGAAKRVPVEITRGGEMLKGREELRAMMRRLAHGLPALRVSSKATWALRAFAGGYARAIGKDYAGEGEYRVMMEGLESFAASLVSGLRDQEGEGIRYEQTSDGRRYISALANRS